MFGRGLFAIVTTKIEQLFGDKVHQHRDDNDLYVLIREKTGVVSETKVCDLTNKETRQMMNDPKCMFVKYIKDYDTSIDELFS